MFGEQRWLVLMSTVESSGWTDVTRGSGCHLRRRILCILIKLTLLSLHFSLTHLNVVISRKQLKIGLIAL